LKTIRLIWVGKSKDPFILEGIEKYLKLLKPYARIETLEVRESRSSDARVARSEEGARILEKSSSFVLLDETGKEMRSLQFAEFVNRMMEGRIPQDIVIGGAFGVSAPVRTAAAERVALSRMTFTHQMARVILLEQLFRAFTILKKRPYHY